MGHRLLRNSLLLLALLPSVARATDVSKRGQATIPTFTDDSYIPSLNRNFTILFGNLIDDKFINLAVCSTCTSLSINFNKAQSDTGYIILSNPSWNSGVWVTGKSTIGCTVNFSSPAAPGTLDAILVR